MKKIYLENKIPVIFKENKNTPRLALCLYLKIEDQEKKAGLYSILNRLLLQGTSNRSAEDLARELDENAIECYSEMKHDFIRFKVLCLNEDIEKALEILEDIVKNSTMEDFSKEVEKMKGEIEAELDSPKSKAADAFYKTLFDGLAYGHTYTKTLEAVGNITKEEIQTAYKNLLEKSPKVISLVGDFDGADMISKLNKYFGTLTNPPKEANDDDCAQLTDNKTVTVEKSDASQAQIFQGWRVPTIFDKDYPVLLLLNTILGSSGLSSRLFVELRDKKGLAYVVRSSYEVYDKAAAFSVYIATEPKNIKTSLDGFAFEINRIKTTPVDETELENAKNNLIGKRQFFTETNLQQSSLYSFYEDKGLGYDFEEKLIAAVKNVSSKDIQRAANEYLKDPHVLTVLAPGEYLEF